MKRPIIETNTRHEIVARGSKERRSFDALTVSTCTVPSTESVIRSSGTSHILGEGELQALEEKGKTEGETRSMPCATTH